MTRHRWARPEREATRELVQRAEEARRRIVHGADPYLALSFAVWPHRLTPPRRRRPRAA